MSKHIDLTPATKTKGTFLYTSTDDNPLITNLYLMKSQIPADAPKQITAPVAFE